MSGTPTFAEVLARVAADPGSCALPVFVSLSPDIELASNSEWSERTSLVTSFPTTWSAAVAKRFHAHPAIVSSAPPTSAQVIGRSNRSAYRIAHESVSGRHAELLVDPSGTYRLSDLRSRNGTQVESVKVMPGSPVVVHSNSLVVFGALEFYLIEPAMVQTLARMTNPVR